MAIIRFKTTKEKLKQELFFKGAKGTYIDLTFLENKNGPDEYGNDGMIVQDISKEARDRGEKGPIVGNGKYVKRDTPAPATTGQQPTRHPTPAAAPAAEEGGW